jgi:hypothetical protein
MAGLTLSLLPVESGVTDFDLFLAFAWQEGRLIGSLGYNTDLFEPETIHRMRWHFEQVLESVAAHPERRFSEVPLLSRQTIAVSATFTAEPIQESLAFWMQQLDLPATVMFAPYNQVFQQLLDPTSLLLSNQMGVNVILIRLEDWYSSSSVASLRETAHDFAVSMPCVTSGHTGRHPKCERPGSRRPVDGRAGGAQRGARGDHRGFDTHELLRRTRRPTRTCPVHARILHGTWHPDCPQDSGDPEPALQGDRVGLRPDALAGRMR